MDMIASGHFKNEVSNSITMKEEKTRICIQLKLQQKVRAIGFCNITNPKILIESYFMTGNK
jgi:hypothetical protein